MIAVIRLDGCPINKKYIRILGLVEQATPLLRHSLVLEAHCRYPCTPNGFLLGDFCLRTEICCTLAKCCADLHNERFCENRLRIANIEVSLPLL